MLSVKEKLKPLVEKDVNVHANDISDWPLFVRTAEYG